MAIRLFVACVVLTVAAALAALATACGGHEPPRFGADTTTTQAEQTPSAASPTDTAAATDTQPAIATSVFVRTELTPGPPAPAKGGTIFSVDLDPRTPGNQFERTVRVGEQFSIDVTLDATTVSWVAYQIDLNYDPSILNAPIAALPTSWANLPILNVAGGNVAPFDGGTICDPVPASLSITQGNSSGRADLAMTCAHLVIPKSSAYLGTLVQLVLRCDAAGSTDLVLVDEFVTFVLDPSYTTYNDHMNSASILCA